MQRREALARLAALTGATIVGAEFFLTGCARTDKTDVPAFTATDIALLDEIGDTIIPTTDTPGAKAAGIGAFMAMMINDCYDDRLHRVFYEGLSKVERACQKATGKSFVTATAAERTTVLNAIDAERRAYQGAKKSSEPAHYFELMKDLTLLGYFSSEVGATQALRYVEAPGAYDGDVPYTKGDRAWFNPTRRY